MKSFNQICESSIKMNSNQFKLYNERLEKSLYDKLFFMKHIFDFDLFVDFGCANGSLIKAVLPYHDADYFGYDLSEDMVSAARNNVSEAQFTSDWSVIEKRVKECKGKSVLNLSSIIHEVYSYGDESDIKTFWDRVLNSGFDYISIRDMTMTKEDFAKPEPKDWEEIKEVLYHTENGKEKIEMFEDVWGPILCHGEFVHLMMKWNYWNNYKREVNEEYLVTTGEIMGHINRSDYNIKYKKAFVLEYLRDYVKDLTDVTITTPTHIKLILVK